MNPNDPFDRPNDPSSTPRWEPSRPSTSVSPTGTWGSETNPAATPVSTPFTTSATPSPEPAPTAASTPTTARRNPRGIAPILGSALLAAVLASGGTFAAVELAVPRPAATPTPAAATNASVATQSNQRGTTTVLQDDITGVVAKAKDSVVTLTSQLATNRGPFDSGTATGVGSGIILTADGYTLTNRHVVEGSQSLTATLADGSEHSASVVDTSSTQDLALVKIDATGLTPATIGDSSGIVVGQTAIAIGSPLGTFTETVTKGIVSALNRSITVRDDLTGRPVTLSGLIQTDAAINPGNSGGPLLNAAGAVVGVNTATASTAEGIGFAIPMQAAQSLIDEAHSASVA